MPRPHHRALAALRCATIVAAAREERGARLGDDVVDEGGEGERVVLEEVAGLELEAKLVAVGERHHLRGGWCRVSGER